MKPPFTSHLSFILGFICQYVQVLHVMGFSAQHWSHTAMKDFADRLTQLEQSTVPESLQSFYEPQLKSFSVQPGAERFSITSTCYALQAMLATENPSIYEAFVLDPKIRSMDDKARTPVRDILRELLASDWRTDDLFQVPLLLYTMLKVDVGRDLVGGVDEQTAARIRSLLQSVFLARPRRRDGMRQAYSDYILFQCAQVYAEIYDGTVVAPPDDTWSENDRGGFTNDFDQSSAVAGFPSQAVPDGAPSSIALALNRCAETSYNTLCRQLALRAAGAEFDVMSLTYALLSDVVTTNKLSNTAGREVVPGQGPSGGTKIRPVNRKLVIAGLAAFMEEQGPDGMWEKGEPIYRSFRRKRNIGNAFIFAVDTVSSLLEHLPAEDFRPHLAKLYKLLEWIEFHHAVEILPEFCDPETGQCYGKAIMGWTSPHLNADSGPQAWSTAQTSACISRMKTTIETLMHNDVLDEFRGLRLSQKGQNGASWDRLLDTDLGKCGMERVCTLKEVLEERMIAPRLNNEDILNESYSAVLFGPPGSAKTTIGQSLAEKIGYDFLTIDTSEFLADGLTCVAARIRYVFSRLQALRRCVILFDVSFNSMDMQFAVGYLIGPANHFLDY